MNPFLVAALEALEEKHTPVTSSFIAAVGYNPLTSTLTVEFKNGNSYTYPGFSYSTYEAFLAAPSTGRIFRERVKGS